jgi:hypothetical protein
MSDNKFLDDANRETESPIHVLKQLYPNATTHIAKELVYNLGVGNVLGTGLDNKHYDWDDSPPSRELKKRLAPLIDGPANREIPRLPKAELDLGKHLFRNLDNPVPLSHFSQHRAFLLHCSGAFPFTNTWIVYGGFMA